MTYNKLRYKSLVDKSLTANNCGWKLDLFASIDEDFICPECKNICKNAVLLDCEFEREEDEHTDDEIKLYCESCMKKVLKNNANKCPISNHSNPIYIASRITRRKISKSRVLCPNSMEYQQKNSKNAIENIDENVNNSTLYSTNEGKEKSNVDVRGCTNFKGTLVQLIEGHIYGCIEQQLLNKSNNGNRNVNHMYLQMIEDLQEEIEILKEENKEMKQNINSLLKWKEMVENEMKMNAETIENNLRIEIENKNAFENQPLIKIPICIHSCRGAHLNYQAQNLLQSGNKNFYASALSAEFAKNEKDWIIFEINDHQFYIPTQIQLINYSSNAAVSRMEVYVGSVADNEWHKMHLQPEITGIEIESKTLQLFELDGYHPLVSSLTQWKHIKVNFTANHGMMSGSGCKFLCHEIQFHGKSSFF